MLVGVTLHKMLSGYGNGAAQEPTQVSRPYTGTMYGMDALPTLGSVSDGTSTLLEQLLMPLPEKRSGVRQAIDAVIEAQDRAASTASSPHIPGLFFLPAPLHVA